jgi:hypothetical protein
MNHLDKKELIRQYPNKSKRKNDRLLKSIYSDRRSGKDRRSSYSIDYFFHGGIERRSWRERRYLWYMID